MKQMINIPQALLIKLATAEESEPGVHIVDVYTNDAVIPQVKVVNRCVALIHKDIQLQSEDICDIRL